MGNGFGGWLCKLNAAIANESFAESSSIAVLFWWAIVIQRLLELLEAFEPHVKLAVHDKKPAKVHLHAVAERREDVGREA